MSLRAKIFVTLFGVIVVSGLLFVTLLFLPSRSEAVVEIPAGTKTLDVARKLTAEGVVRSPWAFILYVKGLGLTLQAGVYRFPEGTTLLTAVKRMDAGDVDEYIVTIPEGWRITQIADRLAERKIMAADEFVATAAGKEGYLFPDTYRIAVGETVVSIIDRMEKNFSTRTKDLSPSREAVILASIVEREAKSDDQRSLIAGVYKNRLRIGMALQADPTIQYALGDWDPVAVSDYKLNSPYNTYMYKGLPPTPICNPGLKSMESAVNPALHDYYYFFHTGGGELVLSKTLDEHNRRKNELLR